MRHRSFAVSMLLAFVTVASGQTREPARRFASPGVVEIGGAVSAQAARPVTDGSTGEFAYMLSADPFAGYFVADGVEIGVSPLGVAWSKAGDNATTDLRFLAAVSYNFRARMTAYPFVEGLAGATVRSASANGTTTTASGFTWGGRAGVKLGVLDHALLVIGAEYLAVTLDPSGSTSRSGYDEISVLVGWTVWF